ncbi:MAG TPA: hypothetical protein PKA27_04915 [Fimbriimonadaceae bacterium]|nr:hypothetical protein [Fimbriimonadaceae bacterium]
MKNRTRYLLVALAAIASATSLAGSSKLTGFKAAAKGSGFEVQILGDNLGKPREIRTQGNKSLVYEFDANLVGKAKREKIGTNGLSYVQSTWFKPRPPKVRVQLRVDPKVKPSISENEDGWLVSWQTTPSRASVVPVESQKATAANNVIIRSIESKPFPNSVPPLEPAPNKPVARQGAPTWATVAEHRERMVSLDFVNTEVVQILKALALQAAVNIVTSPDVKGTLTVSLERVTVNEALDLVTTLAGVRYAKVGKTFVVTASSKFSDAMRQVGGAVDAGLETRVVPIYSGEGNQIKSAILRSTVLDTTEGRIDLVLPSEEVKVEKSENLNPTNGDGKPADPSTKMSIETKSAKEAGKDPYVVVIGPANRLQEIERQVQAVDAQICRALGIAVPSTNSMVRKVYNPRGSKAVDLLKAVAGANLDTNNPHRALLGNVELVATPVNSISEQAIVLYGRESEVNKLSADFAALDANIGSDRGDYLIYEVKFLDPRALREELVVAVPGLVVSIPPASAGNTRIFKPNAAKQMGADQFDENKPQVPSGNQGGQGGGGAAAGASGAAGSANPSGLSQPFQNNEPAAVPMKLVLRGTKEQIDRALNYLTAIDVSPRQVAIELRIMDLSKQDAEKVGIDWSIVTGGSVNLIRMVTGTISQNNGGLDVQIGSGGPSDSRVLATLDSIMTKGNLIARPNIFAFDGRESELFVGDTIRYVESIQSTQNGISVTTGEVSIGVRMALLPRVSANGTITMDLRPQVSTLRGFTPIPGGGQLPQTGNREAQMTVNIKDGETIAIGGLINDAESRTETGIPILKDLPIIGRLFKGTDKQKVRSEVVFFITAKVIDDKNRGNAAEPKRDGQVPPEKAKVNDKIGN